jgi:hypothetical protein
MSFPDIPGITLHETLSTLAVLVTADGTQRKETDLLRPQRLYMKGGASVSRSCVPFVTSVRLLRKGKDKRRKEERKIGDRDKDRREKKERENDWRADKCSDEASPGAR